MIVEIVVVEVTVVKAETRAERAMARKGTRVESGMRYMAETAREARIAVETAASVSSTDVYAAEAASMTSTKTASMATAEATTVTSAETTGVAATGMTSASVLRPERDCEEKDKRRDGE